SKKQYIYRAVIGIGLLAFVWMDHFISYLAILVSIILLFPFLLRGISKMFNPLLKITFGYSGDLAVRGLSQQLNRNANTSAILAVGIAVILLLSAVIESAPEGYENEIRNTYGGDLRVTSETPWSDDDIATILSYESVASVQNLTEATPVTW